MKYDQKKSYTYLKFKDKYDVSFFDHLVSYKKYQLSYVNGVKRPTWYINREKLCFFECFTTLTYLILILNVCTLHDKFMI